MLRCRMRSNEFYNKFNKNIEGMNLEQLKDIIMNVIRKIPETKYEEILDIFNKNIDSKVYNNILTQTFLLSP